jgi:hypothetical protein
VIEVPRGTPHAMIAGDSGARALWQTRPALRTQDFFAGIDQAQQAGGSMLDLMAVVSRHSAEVRFTKPPAPVQPPLFAIARVIAKLRGR